MLETFAPIKLKRLEKNVLRHGTTVIPILLRNKLVIKWRKTNLEVFRIAWKISLSSYRQALKVARTDHIRKLINNNQNNPKFLFRTVARLTNKQMSPDRNIHSQFNSDDFMNFFSEKISV